MSEHDIRCPSGFHETVIAKETAQAVLRADEPVGPPSNILHQSMSLR